MNAAVAQQQAQQVEPAAFRENWKRVLASNQSDELKFVRISGRVANLTNKGILIRYPVDLPDGFYLISNQNELFPAPPYGWLSFPDAEQVRPPFEKMKPLSIIPQPAIHAFVALADAARKDHATILADGRGMCWKQNSQHYVEFPLGINGEGIEFCPTDLKLALTEMLRYPEVALWKEERLDFGKTPAVFGIDWARCVLISGYQRGPYHF